MALPSCQVPYIAEEDLPQLPGAFQAAPASPVIEPVSRQGVITLARRYASHRWRPTKRNVWHGYDPANIREFALAGGSQTSRTKAFPTNGADLQLLVSLRVGSSLA